MPKEAFPKAEVKAKKACARKRLAKEWPQWTVMAFDDYEREFRLTSSGSVDGTRKEGRQGKDVAPPEDRELMMKVNSYTESSLRTCGRDRSGSYESWGSPTASEEDAAALRRKYPSEF